MNEQQTDAAIARAEFLVFALRAWCWPDLDGERAVVDRDPIRSRHDQLKAQLAITKPRVLH